ncbi:GNAT family N-acetyltransferase [Calidifontibacillus erzurumensis]|uniref:GNAT family N-acetyltransferase n=1 Tax=Calidifontibacillus erzurumensis TaxID=2741433 RepID=A0A8J8GFD7_9BACI|nr:GNAT family N-acetyltransferase [Calidifontibacillus erzurumensis]NSL51423.1 GNAT family N-acetyltransferase [Calidifontibacillus erzurumensis]
MFVKIVTTEKELEDAYFIRKKVFVEEQNVPVEIEIDEFENDATHFVLYDGNKPIGAGRVRQLGDTLKVERICVLDTYRHKGCGKLIMDKAEEVARDKAIKKLKLNAQSHAERFYQKLGYETVSDVFMEAGIPHVTMIKTIS